MRLVETCGCCFHVTWLWGLFGYGRKDWGWYVVLFGKTIWMRHRAD